MIIVLLVLYGGLHQKSWTSSLLHLNLGKCPTRIVAQTICLKLRSRAQIGGYDPPFKRHKVPLKTYYGSLITGVSSENRVRARTSDADLRNITDYSVEGRHLVARCKEVSGAFRG